jgi:predicted homoserine dehydrogenase-like protein
MRHGRITDTFAYAKKDLESGDTVEHAIGGNEIYGLIDDAKNADTAGHVPQGVLVTEGRGRHPVIKKPVKRDQPITWADIEIPENRLMELWERQKALA